MTALEADIEWYSLREINEENEIFRGHSAMHTDDIVMAFMQTAYCHKIWFPEDYLPSTEQLYEMYSVIVRDAEEYSDFIKDLKSMYSSLNKIHTSECGINDRNFRYRLRSNTLTVPVDFRELANLIDRKHGEEVFLRRRVISRDDTIGDYIILKYGSSFDIIAKNKDDLEKIARCINFHDRRLILYGKWRKLLWR